MSDEGLNDLFPGPPDRPDTPEFWRLSEIVLKHDSDALVDGGLEKVIEQFVPEDVAGYMAVHRSAAMLEMSPLFVLIRMANPGHFLTIHLTTAAAWNDGFCAGAAYERKYGEKVSE